MFEYRVTYVAEDGKNCRFTFKSEHILRNTFACYGVLHEDMMAAVDRILSNPESAMSRHGFNRWYGIRKIENLTTGHCVIVDTAIYHF